MCVWCVCGLRACVCVVMYVQYVCIRVVYVCGMCTVCLCVWYVFYLCVGCVHACVVCVRGLMCGDCVWYVCVCV